MNPPNKNALYAGIVWLLSATALIIWALFVYFSPAVPGVDDLVKFIMNIDEKYIYVGALISVFVEGLYFIGSFFPGSSLILILAILSQLSGPMTLAVTIFLIFVGWCAAGAINIYGAKLYRSRIAKLEKLEDYNIHDRVWTTWFPAFRSSYEVAQVAEGGDPYKVFLSSLRVRFWASLFVGALAVIIPIFFDISHTTSRDGYVVTMIVAGISLVVGIRKIREFLKGNKKGVQSDIDENLISMEVLSKEIYESLPGIIKNLQETKFQYTGKALVSFIPKCGYLVNSIMISCKNEDVYSASVLFRSLVEHSFRHLYIYVKATNENNDSVGEVYYKSLKGYEDLKSIQKIINYKKWAYPESSKWDTKGEHNKALGDVAKDFDIEKIFQYLVNNNNNDNRGGLVERYKKDYLLERLVEYTNMSSSVHGGPFGEWALYELQKDKGKFKMELDKFANQSFMLHKNVFEATRLFASLMRKENKSPDSV